MTDFPHLLTHDFPNPLSYKILNCVKLFFSALKSTACRSEQVEFLRPLQPGRARNCYASSHDWNNIPPEKIRKMLGNSNMIVPEHYLDGLDPDRTFGINLSILTCVV